ncbi:MAG: S8 family serine peptidase [Planctomycetota bacterium]
MLLIPSTLLLLTPTPALDGSSEEVAALLQPGGGGYAYGVSMGLVPVDQIAGGLLVLFRAPDTGTDAGLAQISFQLAQHPDVIWAEPNRQAQEPETEECTDDEGGEGGGGTGEGGDPQGTSGQQCSVGFVDQTPTVEEFFGQDALAQLHADAAAQYATGAQAVVAVIDTGIDPGHPTFLGKLHPAGYDFLLDQAGGIDFADGEDTDDDGIIDEGYGHGSHVASSVLLVCPDALILPLRVLDSDGNGSAFDVADAIFYAIEAGADIINLSLSTNEPSLAVAAALMWAEFQGVTAFVSAGNSGQSEEVFPGSYSIANVPWTVPVIPQGVVLDGREVVTVGGVNGDDGKASFATYGAHVDLCAPAVQVYGSIPGGGYAWWSGTSMATGLASGAGAFALSVGAGQDWLDALLSSCDPLDALNPDYAGGLGSGRIHLLNAVLQLVNP